MIFVTVNQLKEVVGIVSFTKKFREWLNMSVHFQDGIPDGSIVKLKSKSDKKSTQFLVSNEVRTSDNYALFSFQINSSQLDTYLGDKDSVVLYTELQWHPGNVETYKSPDITFTVEQPVIKNGDTEATPSDLKGPKGDQGPAGPPGPGGDTAFIVDVGENVDSTLIYKGQPVRLDQSFGFWRAVNDVFTHRCIGLLTNDTAVGLANDIQINGIMTLDDWSNITGTVDLDINKFYYLDSVSGKLTSTPTTIVGKLVQEIGYSLTNKKLNIHIGDPVTL